MIGKMQENIRQVNAMFVEERRKVQKRYKEYDGCYLGHYVQWFFWFFFHAFFRKTQQWRKQALTQLQRWKFLGTIYLLSPKVSDQRLLFLLT